MNEWMKEREKDKNYKLFVGPEKLYDKIGKIVFDLCIEKGLLKQHFFLDIGCGSLRIGKYIIPYLYKNRYFGIDPNEWLIQEALEKEFDCDIKEKKNPIFSFTDKFEFDFDKQFDFILANSIFIHAGLEQIKLCINNAINVLKDNGIFIFNYFIGNNDYQGEFSYPKAVKYKKETIENLLLGLNYEYIKVNYPGNQTWIMVCLKNKE